MIIISCITITITMYSTITVIIIIIIIIIIITVLLSDAGEDEHGRGGDPYALPLGLREAHKLNPQWSLYLCKHAPSSFFFT